MSDQDFMRLAIERALDGVRRGQSPFGACIVKDGAVVSAAHNEVWARLDITAHAEMCAIRQACQALQTIDLSGCVLYSTCEPCPMCFAACHWARIDKVVYGARIQDAQAAGFSELMISNREMKKWGGSRMEIVGDFLRDECVEVFRVWAEAGQSRPY